MKKNNKGFSLVELIIVMAIMVVLVLVLAPNLTKFVDQGRRSTDVSSAGEIKTAILADIADGLLLTSGTNVDVATMSLSTLSGAPTVRGRLLSGAKFTATYDVTAGTCSVYVTDGTTSYEVTDPTVANYYKQGLSPSGT